MLLASRSGMTGRGSIAFACSHSARPDGPSLARQLLRIARARCRRWSRGPSSPGARALFGPTPHSRETGRGARNARAAAGRHLDAARSAWPGRRRSSRRTSRSAMPADAGRPTSSAMRARSRRAMSAGAPNSARDAVTSRNASSSDSGSTSGVTEREDVEHALARVGVGVVPRRHDDGVGRQAQRARHRHRAAHAERPHLVRGGQHHAAAGVPAHDHRPARAGQGRRAARRTRRTRPCPRGGSRAGATRRSLLVAALRRCRRAPGLLVLALDLALALRRRRRLLRLRGISISVPPMREGDAPRRTPRYWSTAPPAVNFDASQPVDRRCTVPPLHGRRSSSSTRSSGGNRRRRAPRTSA